MDLFIFNASHRILNSSTFLPRLFALKSKNWRVPLTFNILVRFMKSSLFFLSRKLPEKINSVMVELTLIVSHRILKLAELLEVKIVGLPHIYGYLINLIL